MHYSIGTRGIRVKLPPYFVLTALCKACEQVGALDVCMHILPFMKILHCL